MVLYPGSVKTFMVIYSYLVFVVCVRTDGFCARARIIR